MTILEAYSKYHVHSALQLHQLRVAALAQIICDHLPEFTDSITVVATCLLHDIGNLTKSVIEPTTDWIQDLGYDYWVKTKAEFIAKWGSNDYQATINIVADIHPSAAVQDLIKLWMETSGEQVFATKNLPLLIGKYSDQRVNPEGVVSIEGRIKYLAARYKEYSPPEVQANRLETRRNIEKYLSDLTHMDLSTITNEQVMPIIETLKSFTL